MLSLIQTLEAYHNHLEKRRSANTLRSYGNAIRAFERMLASHGIDVNRTPAAEISTAWIGLFREGLDQLSGSTRKIYLTAVIGWYRYLAEDLGLSVDLEQVRHMARPSLRPGVSQDPPEEIERWVRPVLEHVQAIAELPPRNLRDKLRRHRDRAFVIMLAETGLSIQSLCGLRRADVLWSERRIHGKSSGGLPLPVRLSNLALSALRAYLDSRLSLDDAASRPANTLPVFARHDRAAGDKVLPLSVASARQMLRGHARQALGELGAEAAQPETFYRYYVQRSIRSSLGLLHPVVVLNCRSLFEAGRYDEALTAAVETVEREVQATAGTSLPARGQLLITQLMESDPRAISFSSEPAHQASLVGLFRGLFRLAERAKPVSSATDPVRIFETLAVASLCLRLLSDIE